MANSAYLLGSTVRLTVTFKVGDVATDPTTVSLTVGDASGSPATYTYAASQITRTSAGVFWKEIVPDAAGTWVAIWTGAGDVDAVEEQIFDVVASAHPWATLAYPPIYASVPQFKAALRLKATDVVDEVELLRCLQVASRAIDDATGRQFYAGAVGEVRYFTWDKYGGDLLIDDALAVTAIGFDLSGARAWDTAIDATDYWLLQNRVYPGGPYNRIQLDPLRSRYWPEYRNAVKVTGTWGFNVTGAHPAAIQESCLLRAVRLWVRPDAPLGILESAAGGPPIRVATDADVAELERPYRRPSWIFV